MNNAIEAAVKAGRKRQSPRTGFVHCFRGSDASDTIPTYENFCFALSLIHQKSAASVTEGLQIIQRLLAFQTEEGNFPYYLHEYPTCRDLHLPLKAAPILLTILRDYSPILTEEIKGKITRALHRMLSTCPERADFFWKTRYGICKGAPYQFSGGDAFEELISASLSENNPAIEQLHRGLALRFWPKLSLFLSEKPAQEKAEPQPQPIEYVLAQEWTERLKQDHPHQLFAALVKKPVLPFLNPSPFVVNDQKDFALYWKGSQIHSLFAEASTVQKTETGFDLIFALENEVPEPKKELFEASIYCNRSEETSLWVQEKKATIFSLDQTVNIQTSALQMTCSFEILEGEGDFVGHILHGNRPSQIDHTKAYDWKIAIRTLRRSETVKLRIRLQCRAVDGESHSMHSVIDEDHGSCDC